MGIKYKVNERFFDEWSPEMAYVLGYIYADGSLEDASYLRGKYLRVASTDESSVVGIRKLLQSEHSIIVRQPRWGTFFGGKKYKSKKAYLLRIGSHKIYDSLLRLGLYPNKSLTIKFPIVPKEHLSHFVRGYFDGDGCISLYRAPGKYGQKIMKKLSVIFTSGSCSFLKTLGLILADRAELKHSKVYKGWNRSFQLRYSTVDSIKIFKLIYSHAEESLFLKRKFAIFEQYFSFQPRRVDEEIATILKTA